ncbi:MAG: hypothetical protein Q4C20_01515 [Erysipelotrichaceae bacterium]|nr:hypothetical protein [Erysipelotrichaceae bacterium]
MKKDKEELMAECLQKYREIDEMITSGWKDEAGKLIHLITAEECSKIEKYIAVCQEKEDE